MDSIIFLVLRRMRVPLILLILCYAVAIFGLTLMPGLDDQGRPWHLSLSQAFYVISYTATTIGFGEIPYPFSTPQRLWMLVSIYLTVIAWFYAIGKIITLIQEPTLKRTITEQRFAHQAKRLKEPFFLICGYGETGSNLLEALDRMELRAVVIDINEARLNDLQIGNFQYDIPTLCGDAGLPDVLKTAGIYNRHCRGVFALADDDRANLAVAVALNLLNPNLPVLCRAEEERMAENMTGIGATFVIDPYRSFGELLGTAISSIHHYNLEHWLTGVPGQQHKTIAPPPRGRWIVCGYGRFGKAVVANLHEEGIETAVIEAEPALTGCSDCIVGTGSEAGTLIEAGIGDAVGIVAGTNDDHLNLGIAITARKLKPDVFVVARKNRHYNGPLFDQFQANLTMQTSRIISHECLGHLVWPLLTTFLALMKRKPHDWVEQLYGEAIELIGQKSPETWEITIGKEQTPAISEALSQGREVPLQVLLRDPGDVENTLRCIPLLHVRAERKRTDLKPDLPLAEGDCLLFCGRDSAQRRQFQAMRDIVALNYLMTGRIQPNGLIWRWFAQKP